MSEGKGGKEISKGGTSKMMDQDGGNGTGCIYLEYPQAKEPKDVLMA